MRKRHHRTTKKFGIEIPKTIERAYELDKENGNTLWRNAIEKEMKTVKVAFDIQPDGSPRPPGKKCIHCHIIFDTKAGTLLRKARCVADGSKVLEPECNTYASIISRESVRLVFMIAALNDLEVFFVDCEGACLNAPCRENLYTICGPEFGECPGCYAVIAGALGVDPQLVLNKIDQHYKLNNDCIKVPTR